MVGVESNFFEVRGVFEKVKKPFDGGHSGWGVRQGERGEADHVPPSERTPNITCVMKRDLR